MPLLSGYQAQLMVAANGITNPWGLPTWIITGLGQFNCANREGNCPTSNCSRPFLVVTPTNGKMGVSGETEGLKICPLRMTGRIQHDGWARRVSATYRSPVVWVERSMESEWGEVQQTGLAPLFELYLVCMMPRFAVELKLESLGVLCLLPAKATQK